MGLMTQKRKGRPPNRPDDYVPGTRSGVPLFLRVESKLKKQLEEARKAYNRENDLDLNLQQFTVKLLKGQLRTIGHWDEDED